jgi:hypothetical protein
MICDSVSSEWVPAGPDTARVVQVGVVLAMVIAHSLLTGSHSKPNLIMSIEMVAFPAPTTAAQKLIIIVAASIKNKGAPSIVDSWGLLVRPFGAQDFVRAELVAIPANGLDMAMSTSAPRHVHEHDALYDKVGNAPLPTGGKQVGYLPFELTGISAVDLVRAGTQ